MRGFFRDARAIERILRSMTKTIESKKRRKIQNTSAVKCDSMDLIGLRKYLSKIVSLIKDENGITDASKEAKRELLHEFAGYAKRHRLFCKNDNLVLIFDGNNLNIKCRNAAESFRLLESECESAGISIKTPPHPHDIVEEYTKGGPGLDFSPSIGDTIDQNSGNGVRP